MASLEWEHSNNKPLAAASERAADAEESGPAAAPLHGQTAVDWIRERQEAAAVERLFAVLEENQVAIAALAQAWRHTSRALELTQAELALTQEMLAAERREHSQNAANGRIGRVLNGD